MKILVVEDHPENIRELEASVVARFPKGTVILSRSRDSALEALRSATFDLVILDRQLPTRDGVLDEDVAHGEAVYGYIRSEVPGTPIRFWTAFPDDEYYSEKMKHVHQEDLWGTGEQPTIDVIKKSRFDLINEQLDHISRALTTLEKIEVRQRPERAVQLSDEEKKLLRLATKRLGGDALVVSLLGGGYSEAKVLRVEILQAEKRTHLAVAKLTSIKDLPSEVKRYGYLHRLAPGAAPNIICQVKYGAGLLGGTFYQLADGYDRSVFDALKERPESGVKIVGNLVKLMKRWAESAKPKKASIRDIRRQYVSDEISERVAAELGINLEDFEGQEVTFMEACTHGDLHGENVLLRADYEPILIDFGEIGEHPAAIDPLALELSALFHSAGLLGTTGWPTAKTIENWHRLDEYLQECPYPDYVRQCRNWAWEAAAGERALYATAYAYAMRQFKYQDTNKAIASALVRSLIAGYRQT